MASTPRAASSAARLCASLCARVTSARRCGSVATSGIACLRPILPPGQAASRQRQIEIKKDLSLRAQRSNLIDNAPIGTEIAASPCGLLAMMVVFGRRRSPVRAGAGLGGITAMRARWLLPIAIGLAPGVPALGQTAAAPTVLHLTQTAESKV